MENVEKTLAKRGDFAVSYRQSEVTDVKRLMISEVKHLSFFFA